MKNMRQQSNAYDLLPTHDIKPSISSSNTLTPTPRRRSSPTPPLRITLPIIFLTLCTLLILLTIRLQILSSLQDQAIQHLSPPPQPLHDKTPIPTQIWIYEEGPIPSSLPIFLENWKRHHPNHTITLLTPLTLYKYIILPAPTFQLIPAHIRVEWVKLIILVENGGIWVEPSTVFTQPLNLDGPSIMVGKQTFDVIASAKNGQWITAWLNEFNTFVLNFGCDERKYLEYLRDRYGDEWVDRLTFGNAPIWRVVAKHVFAMDPRLPRPNVLKIGTSRVPGCDEVGSCDILERPWREDMMPGIMSLRSGVLGKVGDVIEMGGAADGESFWGKVVEGR